MQAETGCTNALAKSFRKVHFLFLELCEEERKTKRMDDGGWKRQKVRVTACAPTVPQTYLIHENEINFTVAGLDAPCQTQLIARGWLPPPRHFKILCVLVWPPPRLLMQ